MDLMPKSFCVPLVPRKMEELVSLLQQQNQLLQALLSDKDLGFCNPPIPRYIYANRQYPECLWYFWDFQNSKPIPILTTALKGVVTGIRIEEKEFRGKSEPKLQCEVLADQRYVIVCGFDTLFAKGLLSALATLTKEQINAPIVIAAEPGDTEQVLFCKVYINSEYVFAPYTPDTDWDLMVSGIVAKLPPSMPRAKGQTQDPPQHVAPAPRQSHEEIDLSDLVVKIGIEVDRVGWTKKQGSAHLQQTYGKKTRAELDAEELIGFLNHLKGLPTKDLSTIPM